MPGRGHRFSAREEKVEKHIESSEVERGFSRADAARIGWGHIAEVHKKEGHKQGQ